MINADDIQNGIPKTTHPFPRKGDAINGLIVETIPIESVFACNHEAAYKSYPGCY